MMCFFSSKLQTAVASGVDTAPTRKLKVLLLMLLVSHVACDAQTIAECCRQDYRSCRLYLLLCRTGSGMGERGTLAGDASAGILTLGKREGEERRVQSRLNQLLQVSRNQAAGILTMGRRTGNLEHFLMPLSATSGPAALSV